VLVNPLDTWRHIHLSMTLRTSFDAPQNIRVSSGGHSDDLPIGRVLPWERDISLPPLGQAAISFSCPSCKRTDAPADPRQLYFVANDLKVQDR
jgi:hypothetical protein